jgi:DNA transformation protein and related proteins
MAGFQDQLEELFATIEGATLRRMFGGLGIFKNGLMFALVADDVLYMKADEATAPRFAAEGFGQWIYPGRGRAVPMPYWQVPDRLFDEPDEFREWALVAFDVAERTKKKPKAKKPAKKIANPAKKPAVKKAAAAKRAPAKKPKPKTTPKRR